MINRLSIFNAFKHIFLVTTAARGILSTNAGVVVGVFLSNLSRRGPGERAAAQVAVDARLGG